MRWPWTSVARLDDMMAYYEKRIEEIQEVNNWFRTQNAQLTENLLRVQRFHSGMTEMPRRDRPTPMTMPKELRDYARGFQNPNLGKEMRRQYYKRNQEGESWEEIMDDVLGPSPQQEYENVED